MRRRRFVGSVGAATWLGLGRRVRGLVETVEPGAAAARHWIWVHGRERSREEWVELFDRVRRAGIRGALLSGSDPVTTESARAAGLEVERWLWTLNRSGDAWVKEHHPEWFSVSRSGKSSLDDPPYVDYYQWLCPTREPVREYLRGVVDEVSREPGIAGVHLDYVRHPDVILPIGLWAKYDLVQDGEYPEFDFCYCDVCREAFRKQSGTDPLDLPDPPADEAWRRFRWDSVTGLVRVLADAVRANGKRISAAVFPTPEIARRLVRQAWEEWPVDAVFPMIYQGFYQREVAWIEAATRAGVTALQGRIPLYSGLYLPQLSPPELAAAVRYARRGGAGGVSLFDAGSLSDEHVAQFRAAAND